MVKYNQDSLKKIIFIFLEHCKEIVIITSYRVEMELEIIIRMKCVTKLGTESKSPESQFRGLLPNTRETHAVNENALWGR